MSLKIDLEYIKQNFKRKITLYLVNTRNRQKLYFKCFCGREDFNTWSYFSTAKDFDVGYVNKYKG